MGFGDKVKDIYFSAEEKWYGMLDKLDEHVPVYKVVDKVDQVVPSFALFIIIIIILLLLLGIGLFGLVGGAGGEVVLQLSIVDNQGNGISGAQVTLDGIDETYYSNDFGLVEDITVGATRSIAVTATKGDKTKDKTIYLDESPKIEEIKLPVDSIVFDSMTALFMTETGQRINDRLNLSYRCTSGNGTPNDDVIYNGSANINVASTCGTLSVTITSEKYETTTKTISTSAETFYLLEKVPAKMVTMSVQLKSGGTLITENVSVKAFRMNNLYLPADTVVSANGVATFTLAEGNYKFATVTEAGYRAESISNVAITTGMDPVELDLTKSVIGKILVTTKKGSIQVSDVFISLTKSGTEINDGDTNEDGEISFEVADTGPYTVTATKEGYCSETQTAISVGDTVDIDLTTDTGNCGGTLLVKVFDQDNKPVQYARTIIFGEKEEDSYKLGHVDKLTDYNGEAEWEPVNYSETGEQYRIFAFKGSYTGWSTLRDFTALNESEAFSVKLNIPLGSVNVVVKDKDGDPISFTDQEPVYVRLYEDFGNNPISGKKIIEDPNGLISFVTKAGRRVYAVVEKNGYQSHMTLPKDVIGDGTLNFEVTLYRPPIDELYVNSLGLYKNGSRVLKVEPGQEYDVLFELVAPKDYDELGIFVRVGRDDYTKTELDKIYIQEMVAPGAKDLMRGATYNAPKGYSTDQKYLNQDESKWAQAIWQKNGFVQGRIMVAAKIKIRENATVGERLTIGYRAWGVFEGSYERDKKDAELGTSASNSTKQELYAAVKEEYTTVGMETLCEESGDRAFCITSTYTDPDGLTSSFDTTFDAKNSSNYNLFIKVMNASSVGFDISKVKLENDEENLYLGNYSLYTPTNELKTGSINGNDSEWIEANNYTKNSSITFNELKMTPTSTGYGSLKLRIRDEKTILFEKTFGINISSNKKMRAEYMYNSNFQDAVPKLVSGKLQVLTIRAKNNANGLEIDSAMIKLYDRFGNKLTEKKTNSLGTASISIPASLPSEKLTIKIEKADYETYEEEIMISEDIVEIDPTTLGFTVNPQTKTEETKTVKIENKTGFDLTIKEIKLTGKFKGKLNESQIQSWLYNYTGTTIATDDYEELNLKIISSTSVRAADDLTGKFQITVTNGYTEWVKEIDATIRVGLGKDADDPNCLAITQNNWTDTTQGEQVSIGFEVINNCTVDGTPIDLINLAAKDAGTGNILGTFSVQSDAAYTEVVRGFARTFQPQMVGQEIVPITLNFIPDGGVNGQTTGSIIFQAKNETDSKDQVIQASISYTIDAINLSECITIGADLIRMSEEETGSFSVTNNCPNSTYFEIKTSLMTSDDKFTLTSGETKEVSLTGADDEVGAFNTLIYAREGSSAIELIENVKTIIDPDGGCFSLSRYEFDIYDAPDDDYDGADSAVLKNSCTQKSVSTTVTGTEPYDTDNLLQSAVLGALAGGIGCAINNGGLDAACLGFGFGNNDNNNRGNAQSREAQHRRTPTTGNDPAASLSRKITTGQQNVSRRLNYSASKLVDASGTFRNTTNVYADSTKLAEETISTLERQRDQILSNKEVIKRKLFDKKSNVAPTDAEIIARRDSEISDINDAISDVNDALNEMNEATATFNTKLNEAINTANASVRDVATRARMDISENRTSDPNLQTRFDAEVEKGVSTINTAFTQNIGSFEETMEENMEKIKTIVEDQKTNLGKFKTAAIDKQVALEDAQKQATEDRTKLKAGYDKQVGEVNAHIDSVENQKETAEAGLETLNTKLSEAREDAASTDTKKKAAADLAIAELTTSSLALVYLQPFTELKETRTATISNGTTGGQAKLIEFQEAHIESMEAYLQTLATEYESDDKILIDIENPAISAQESQNKFTEYISRIIDAAVEEEEKLITAWEELIENKTDRSNILNRLRVSAGSSPANATTTITDCKSHLESMPSFKSNSAGASVTQYKGYFISTYTNQNINNHIYNSSCESVSQHPTLEEAKAEVDRLTGSATRTANAATQALKELESGESTKYQGYSITAKNDKSEYVILNPEGRDLGINPVTMDAAITAIDEDLAKNTPPTVTDSTKLTEAQFSQVINTLMRTGDPNMKSQTFVKIEQGFVSHLKDGQEQFNYIGNNNWESKLFEDTDAGLEQLGSIRYYHYSNGVMSSIEKPPTSPANFLLSTTTRAGSSSATSQTSANSTSSILNQHTSTIMGAIASWNSGSLIGGAALSALIELTQASDTLVDEGYNFTVDYVTVSGVTLNSSDGIALSVGDSTYDYDSFYTSTGGGAASNINNQTLATTYNLIGEQDLTFTNPSGLVSDTPYQPYEAILTVTGSENVYEDSYNYDAIRAAAIARGDYNENDAEWYEFWDVSETEIADMEEEDLTVDETRIITKDFHLLFNSFEYTTTVDPVVLGNCTVGAKTGSTGTSAVPKMLFDWDWSNIAIDQCDEANSDYDYCDSTQFTTTILKKLSKMKEFFRTNSIGECPQSIDISGTKTQSISETALDVGITQTQATDSGAGARLEVVVTTNNSLPMDIDLDVKVYQQGTTNVMFSCAQTKTVTSTASYYCDVDTSTSGTGTFDVVSTITPDLCEGCENSDTANDVLTSQLVIGQTGVQDCLYYRTQKDYFEDVLAANNLLGSTGGQDMLGYLNYTTNLVRDGFSNDFKADYHDYMNQFTVKPTIYTDLEEEFKKKVNVTWPEKPGAWEAGKYNVRIVVEFEEDNWTWNDANDIKSIDIILSEWARPDVSHAIYDVGFNGLVGVYSDNGRLGYGASFTQLSEDPLTIVSGIDAIHNTSSNSVSEVRVDVDKDFYTMNTSRRGNVLTINRRGNTIDLILSPSTAVPLLLDVTRNTARDAYAFYTVEVDGQPQSTGSSLITWNGIGNGCVDFDRSGMGTWSNAPDSREGSGNGYGLGGSIWTNAVASGTASFYGTFYVPDGSSSTIYFTRQSENATFTSDQGNGDLLTINTSSGISTLDDVFSAVANNQVCVIGGEYFWNSKEVYQPIESEIISRSNTCMTITS
jgi:hypothetical protein